MKKASLLFFLILFLSGCATYKFQHGKPPYDKGYVASRDDYVIPEYTLGKDNTVPDRIAKAKERLQRRRNIVEDYYKRMGYIENRFKMTFMDPAVMFLKLFGGVFRLPFIAVSDYRYAHNPVYREKIKKLEREKDAREEAWINKLKSGLNSYIQKDLAREPQEIKKASAETAAPAQLPEKISLPPPPSPIEEEKPAPPPPPTPAPPAVVVEAPPVEKIEPQAEPAKPREEILAKELEKAQEEKIQETAPVEKPLPKKAALGPHAVIIARPAKGYSPLRVSFSASKSSSPGTRIIAYSWDFGDGDKSTKPSPVNTYYSGAFGSQFFTVTLTVTDDKGRFDTAATSIEVLNK